MTPAEELRAAAAKLRETAEPTVPGPYTAHAGKDKVSGEVWRGRVRLARTEERIGTPRPYMADWMALVHPGLAEPLAKWLEKTATQYDEDTYMDSPNHGDACGPGASMCDGHAEILFCDLCGHPLEPETDDDDQCGCWDEAIRTARVILGTA